MIEIAILALILVGILFPPTMIDIWSERTFPLAQAPKVLPRRRRGRKIHVSTLYRWTISGCRGVILESIQIGGTRATSLEALQRFFEQLSNKREGEAPASTTRSRSAFQRQQAAAAAAKELRKLGV